AERIARIERGETVVVGVNRWQDGEPSPLTAGDGAIMQADPEAEADQISRLRAWREARDERAVRAALAALAGLGVEEVRLVARDAERAGALAQALAPGARLFALEAAGEAFAGALVVNATSLGMRGGPAVPEALLAALEAAAGLFDMVYAPLETPFLVRARALGLPAVDGLVMLVGQAAAAFAAFFGLDPVRERDGELRALLAGVA
ncbi:MAG: methylmalonyl-CoA mutase family protein, partial [Thermaurantiacus tibetensis]